jgi:hypothetical protein
LKRKKEGNANKMNNIKDSSVADLHHGDADPDPSLHFDADPDPATQNNVRNTEWKEMKMFLASITLPDPVHHIALRVHQIPEKQ